MCKQYMVYGEIKNKVRKWATQCVNLSLGICRQRRPRSACASAQPDQDHRCPLTELLENIECINGEQMPGGVLAHAWDESESVLFAHARRHIFNWRGINYGFEKHIN